ncbi:MAG TPA: hypothetical protein PLP97_02370 [Prevotella sp.]|nr:hypothetical protein [Prevotella sp.]
MKKFTFIAMLLAVFAMTAKAQVMDKYFFKVPTDKMSEGWIIQDEGNFAATPGKEYLEVQNKKNGGRMLNYFWNEAAWAGVDPATLPNSSYKFTMDLNMSNMAARAEMEFVLLPVGICTPTDNRVSTHNYHWYKVNNGDDYFFRWRVGEKPAAANGDYTIWINEEPTAKNDWNQTTEETLTLSSQKTYKFAVVINTAAKTATYSIADEEGTVLKTGVHNYTCEENRAGIFVFGMNGTSTHQLSNIGLSYEAEGPFANEPTSELISVMKTERDYYVNFKEGETLHWIQLGDAEDVISGQTYNDGEEYAFAYENADDNSDFNSGDGECLGNKIIYCTVSGNLKMWTTLDSNGAKSDDVVVPVVCEDVVMPTPKATISNVSEGYAKEYTLTADNSETLLKPTVTIHYTVKDASGNKTKEGDVLTGEKININDKGSLEIYSWDQKNPEEYYTKSDVVTVENNAEYEVATSTNYALTKDECSTAKTGFTVSEIVDNANKSHWDRAYSTQKYGYNENGEASIYVDGTDYAWVKEGWGFYDMSEIGTDNAKWNALVPDDPTTAFAPLAPTEAFTGNSKYVASAWNIFPLEGIVYYNTAITNATLTLDPKYTSDDANKPNFYVVHTRGGYDRPDKGDCNVYTVCVAGEDYSLYRYDTALCDVKVMTYRASFLVQLVSLLLMQTRQVLLQLRR